MSERDYASEIDALAKRIEAIERASTCKGCGKPLLPENAWTEDGCPCNSPKGCNSPAQADVGEASAVSEWPRYFESVCFEGVGRLLMFSHADGYGVDIEPGGESRVTDYDLDEALNYVKHGDWREVPAAEAEARIAAAKGEKPSEAFKAAADIEAETPICNATPASSQPPFAVGQVVECVDNMHMKYAGLLVVGRHETISECLQDAPGEWLVKIEGHPRIKMSATRFRPIPAPVEQGPTSEENNPNACSHGYAPLTPADVEQLRSDLTTARRELGEEKADRQDAAEKLRAVIMAVSEYTSSPPHRRDDHSCLLCRMLESPDYKTYRDSPVSKGMFNAAVVGMGEKINEQAREIDRLESYISKQCGQDIESLQQQVSSLTLKLAEAEKELERRQSVIDDWNSWRDKLTAESVPTPGMKAAVDHACIGAGASGSTLLRIIVQYVGPEFQVLQQQLSAATAANVERDRAAEAMEWWRKNPCPVVWDRDQRSYGVWGWKCGSRYADNPATALILAARDAAEGNG